MVTVEDPGDMNRWLVLVKWLLAIPHYIVLFFLWIAAFFVGDRRVLRGDLHRRVAREPAVEFVVGVIRWTMRVNAYVFLLLTDEYPPFIPPVRVPPGRSP